MFLLDVNIEENIFYQLIDEIIIVIVNFFEFNLLVNVVIVSFINNIY